MHLKGTRFWEDEDWAKIPAFTKANEPDKSTVHLLVQTVPPVPPYSPYSGKFFLSDIPKYTSYWGKFFPSDFPKYTVGATEQMNRINQQFIHPFGIS